MESTSVPLQGAGARRMPKPLLRLRPDEHLVARIRGGDLGAFEVLYERYLSGILSFCRHMLGSVEEAEDAVQLVFASAHRELSKPGAEMRIKPWLYTVARNRCLTVLRARHETVEAELGDVPTAGLDASVEQRADLRELLADLRDLPEDQRAALVLAELGDLSHQEVGAVLGCEASKVKGLVFRARSGLMERRDARGAACEEIREELSTARRGALRRGRLRHHLSACPGCAGYLEEVRRQRKGMALLLPVIPTLGLKDSVLAATGLGGGAAGGGTAAGGLFAGLAGAGPAATVAKVAVVGALAGSAGVVALDRGSDDARPPAGQSGQPAGLGGAPVGRPEAPGARPEAPGVRSASQRGALGRERAAGRGRKTRTRRARRPGGTRVKKQSKLRAPKVRKPKGGGRLLAPKPPKESKPVPERQAAPKLPPERSVPREAAPVAPAPVEPKAKNLR